MHRFALSVATALLAISQVGAQSVSSSARETVQTVRELRAIGVPNFGEVQNNPPARVPGLLRQLNRQLRALIIETLNDRSRLHTVASEEEITEQLRAAGWAEIPSHKWNAYGEISQINFDWKPDYDPGILIVSTQLWIPCGSTDPDSAIYVFRGRARNWELVLAADADFDPAGGLEESGMQYQLSAADANGGWYLAIAHAPPICRSAPGSVRYKILRPGRNADEPRVLLNRREPINQFFEPPFRLRAEMDWFAVTRGKRRRLDGEPGISVSRFEVSALPLTRLQPLALSVEDFLDEWVQLDEDEAARWSSASRQAGIREWHSKLHGLAFDSTEMEFVQLCPKQEGTEDVWLIALWIDQQQNPSSREERLYIVVVKKFGAFYVDSVSRSRPAGCPGKTPHKTISDRRLPDW